MKVAAVHGWWQCSDDERRWGEGGDSGNLGLRVFGRQRDVREKK